ncbi:MAG: DUF308 domain-containing protein [Ruminococcus sp.]|nr:DUF308 domain-containing protein [Ruminococcus sp.]
MSTLKKYWPTILIILLEMVIGVLLIVDAEKLTVAVFTLFGIALLILALVMLVRYLRARKEEEESVFTLITAIFAFIVGLVLAVGASMLVEVGAKLYAIFYGAVMIVNGVMKIGEYISLKKQGAAASGLRIVSGILSIVLGVVAIVFNDLALATIGIIIGVTLLVEAVLDIATLVMAHRLNKSLGLYDTSGDDSDYDLE